ncbi:unnamed protein product [Rotaria sordida]|uniref:2Fe-2S ferredoxin-type domain-containing protein n=1 Tax=Rotaria sordida TaxID=392033 RepID=A0A815T1B2_9BILA|nr:unnamed protein product [Rotaria sordida]CAF1497003.1 unnamed protein product [Rotaria sordida]
MIDHLLFYVNGKEILERNVEPEWTLLWYLRNKLRLTGSKLGCGEGGCGACTVLVSRSIDRDSGEIEHRTINACLAPLCSVDGCHVITVEGLGSTNKSNLHSTQIRLAELFATQCGFCTPGIVMSLYGTVTSKDNSLPTMEDIEESFDGNLCRCTGYRPILDAAKTFACDINKLDYQKSSLPRTSTTYDKCYSYVHQNTLPIDQVQFPDKLRDYIPQSIHIKDINFQDVGKSLNPQIDIGQIEGGFMQGIGLFTMEELIWGDEKLNKWIPLGQLYTCGVDTYKIPSFSDVPLDFRVSLLSDSSNPRAIYSSKGIGEPPILLATSAFFALKQACQAYRKQQGLSDYFTLHSPATVERLRMVCADEFTRRVCPDEYETFQPKGSY